jgi:hypothetical protein
LALKSATACCGYAFLPAGPFLHAMQMLNTICKRVTQIQPRLTGGSECSSRTTSDAYEIFRSTSSTSFANMSPKSHRGSGTGVSALGLLSQTAAGAAAGGSGSFHGISSSGSANLSSAAAQQQQLQYEVEAAAAVVAAGGAGNGAAAAAAHARALQLAQLAEQKDLQGLEAALEAAPAPEQDESDESSGQDETGEFAAAMQQAGSAGTSAAAANGNDPAAATSRTASAPPHLQAQASVGPPPSVAAAWHAWQQGGALPPTPHTPVTPSRQGKPGKLTVQDKDVLLVLTAFCKLASREAPGSSGSESVLAQGKLLALEMLAKVRAHVGQQQPKTV